MSGGCGAAVALGCASVVMGLQDDAAWLRLKSSLPLVGTPNWVARLFEGPFVVVGKGAPRGNRSHFRGSPQKGVSIVAHRCLGNRRTKRTFWSGS